MESSLNYRAAAYQMDERAIVGCDSSGSTWMLGENRLILLLLLLHRSFIQCLMQTEGEPERWGGDEHEQC